MAAFGLVFPGRSMAIAPGGALLRQVDATHYVLDLGACGVADALLVSTACLFLTDAAALPQDGSCALSLYVQSPGREFEWRGAVTLDRPSALIQLRWPPAAAAGSAQLGITLEPRAVNVGAAGTEEKEQAKQAGQVQFARQVGIDLLRYVSSFMGDGAQVATLLERWWKRFEDKYTRDPNFLAAQSLD